MLLFDVDAGGRIEKPFAGPRETAGGVGQPGPAGIANAAAHGANIVPTLFEVRARRRELGDNVIGRQVVRKGQIGFDAEQQA